MTDREKAQKPWYKKWWAIGIGVVFLIGFLGSMGDGSESGSTTTTIPVVAAATPTTEAPETTTTEALEITTTTLAPAPTTTVAPKPTTTVAPTTTQPQFTRSEENAIKKAGEYLDFMAFSRSGLIDQLEYEGFTTADATLGVDSRDTDWNEQAWKKAEEYLDYTSFSRSGLIDQLEYEGFTTEQATYGVDKTGL